MANTSKLVCYHHHTVMFVKLDRNIEAKRISLSSNTFDMRTMFDAYYAEGSIGEKVARVGNQLELAIYHEYLN